MTTTNCTIVEKTAVLPAPIAPDDTGILVRIERNRPYTPRLAFWYAPRTGELIIPDGSKRNVDTSISFEGLLDGIKCISVNRKAVTLHLLAGQTDTYKPTKSWFEVHHWQGKLFWKQLTGTYQYDGFTVYLQGTGGYFGNEVKDIVGIHDAWQSLEQILEDAFHTQGYAPLADTPAATGRKLILVSLPKGREYPRVSADLRDFLHHNFTQGRIETLPPAKVVLEDGVHILDGKWFYSSGIWKLPVGPCYRDKCNEFLGVPRKDDGKIAPTCPAFYLVEVTVPKDWHHIGLLKEYTPKEGESIYPREPGYTFSNWAQAHEVALLINNHWNVDIKERIYWPDTDNITCPLATLFRKLIDLRKNSTNEYHRSAIRAIVLHMIGAFHSIGTVEKRFTANRDLPLKVVPYKNSYHSERGGIVWSELRPFDSERRNSFIHPEWSATVWGRARARLAEFALQLPFEDIVSLRSDAVWSASKLESENTDKPGSFREKDFIKGPWAWPKDGAEMRKIAIKRNLEAEEEESEE